MNLAVRPIPESYWVIPGHFLAGEYPGHSLPGESRRRLEAFLQQGFDTFFDLTRPGELEPYESILRSVAGQYRIQPDYRRFPIGDFGLPEPLQMATSLDAIEGALSAGRRVYLHCWGGIGRTGTTVGCFLVRRGLIGDQALQQLADWWRSVPKSGIYPRSPETDAQARFIRDWTEPERHG